MLDDNEGKELDNKDEQLPNSENDSCEAGVSRKEFISMVLKRAAIAGAVVAAPKVVDKFLVPPAQAATSTSGGHRP